MCALGGIFILTLPIPIVVNSFASYYKNRDAQNTIEEVSYVFFVTERPLWYTTCLLYTSDAADE